MRHSLRGPAAHADEPIANLTAAMDPRATPAAAVMPRMTRRGALR